ncbi:MAG: antibiotic biosynthesis monooxygenase family protein [Bacteroidota bacterium]
MIRRIVKMSFQEDQIEQFIQNFENNKNSIRQFDGCHHLELWRDKNEENVFFTYSHWDDEDALNKYRNSELFEGIWSTTKKMFNAKPLAWSVEIIG